MLGAIPICHGSLSSVQNLCHLKDEKTHSSNVWGSIWNFSLMWGNKKTSEFLSLLSCLTDKHLSYLAIAMLAHYSFKRSRESARLQPRVHHAQSQVTAASGSPF